jgi:hypothetical protein
MSAVSSVSSSASVSYATQLAQTSALRRSLNSLGNAVQTGDLTSAGSILTAIINANPQYASTASDGSTSQDPINQDFQTLANAISSDQVDAAQSAWTQVKSDLAQSGVTDLSDGTADTAQLLAQTKASIDQQIVSSAFGTSSAGGLSAASLIGASSGSTGSASLSSSIISSWLTYQEGGSTASLSTASTTGNNLDTSA